MLNYKLLGSTNFHWRVCICPGCQRLNTFQFSPEHKCKYIQIGRALLRLVNISPQECGLVAHCEVIELVLTLGPKFQTPQVGLDYNRIRVQNPQVGTNEARCWVLLMAQKRPS